MMTTAGIDGLAKSKLSIYGNVHLRIATSPLGRKTKCKLTGINNAPSSLPRPGYLIQSTSGSTSIERIEVEFSATNWIDE